MVSDFERALHILQSPDQELTREILSWLSSPTREESALFAHCFPTIDVERRRDIIARMVACAEESFYLDYGDLFRACLGDVDPFVRRQAIEGLWEDERLDLLRRLLQLVHQDPDPQVRAAAATSLGRFLYLAEVEMLSARYGEQVREALERIIQNRDEDIEVVRRAVESIAFINDDDVRRIIGWAYDQDHPLMRISAVFAMGRSADPVWSETVLIELDDASPEMRFEAARAAGELQLRRAVPQLARLLHDPDREVQEMAIWALGQIGGKRARRLLEELVDSEDEVIAAAAEDALDELDFAVGMMDLMVINPDETDMVEVDLEEWDAEEELEDDFGADEDEAQDSQRDQEDDWPDEVIDLG
ncbi:MAG: HEAT repeat domain-containing protein [Chloroflexi bacterium]|nr:HEAT repeat domain-containing protein [Chloroflexota bacterium]